MITRLFCVTLLNERFSDYAGFPYVGAEPDYSCLAFFATKVSEAMVSDPAARGDNKWVIEQMLDIEAPAMVALIRKLLDKAIAEIPGITQKSE